MPATGPQPGMVERACGPVRATRNEDLFQVQARQLGQVAHNQGLPIHVQPGLVPAHAARLAPGKDHGAKVHWLRSRGEGRRR